MKVRRVEGALVQDLWNTPAVWGFAGAFIYAGPKFATCFHNARMTRGPWSVCAIDFAVCLVIGLVASAAATEMVQNFLKMTGPAELRAIATAIGLIANPAAPGVTRVLTKRVVSQISEGDRK